MQNFKFKGTVVTGDLSVTSTNRRVDAATMPNCLNRSAVVGTDDLNRLLVDGVAVTPVHTL